SGQQGFTLLEILIALAIFSIMSMMAYAGLAAVLDARASTVPRSEQLAQLQTTLYLLNEDLSQIINRPIRDEFGTTEPAFSVGRGNEILVLTRTVPSWSNNSGVNSLLRVSYSLEKDALYRRVWSIPDRTQQTEYRSRKLITTHGVALSKFNVETQTWEPLIGGIDIPKALDISIKLDGLGTIHRSFLIH
ncbi:MAG: type II secretion system minor pseudopilin GspJ, partial [Methylococcales bacterium]